MNERLKEVREFFEMTQSDFGNKIGIKSRAHISALESGTRNVTDRIISDVCREFGVSKEWLRTGEGEMFPCTDEQDRLYALFGATVEKETAKKRLVAMGLLMTDEEAEAFERFIVTMYNGLFPDKK